jgi:putative membrane protein
MKSHGDDATPPCDTDTALAFERTRLSYERTLMAWISTATSLITFGFTIYKYFQFDASRQHVHAYLVGPREFALVLIAVGLLALALGLVEHVRGLGALRRQYPALHRATSWFVALVVLLLGLAAFLAVIFRA